MKIGLWNIDHPEAATSVASKEMRFGNVMDYLMRKSFDIYVLTETNAALDLPGYFSEFSAVSPFSSKSRCYGVPNRYCQVGIYSLTPIERLDVREETNGLLCRTVFEGCDLFVYGNVITIKDQWSKTSTKNYTDRLDEQIEAMERLPECRTLVGGDFNLRKNWPQRVAAHQRILDLAGKRGWAWPTESVTNTVQHVLHTPDLRSGVRIDLSVKQDSGAGFALSDHPFLEIELNLQSLCP